MFKNLKDKLATQVNKTNQTLFSAILPTDSISSSKDSGIRTSSITSHDDPLDNNRFRLDSASSDISQTTTTNSNYVSPTRSFIPPSDIESEHGGDESDHETNSKMQKRLDIYKNKFIQLKNAYNEVEREKDRIKNILQQHQDTSIKRQTDLREKIKFEQQAKEQIESLYKKEITLRDNKIEELTQQLTVQQHHVQVDQEEIRNLREKNTKQETLLARCKEAIKTNQEKQSDLITERDDLLQKLNEKQQFIESLMKDRHSEEASATSVDVKEHFNSDISVLLHDKERLQEELESTRLYVRQLETNLELAKEQQQNIKTDINDEIKYEQDEFKQKYEDLVKQFDEKTIQLEQLINDKLNLEISNKEFQDLIKNYQEIILKNKQQIEQLNNDIEILKDNLSKENEQHLKSFDTLKTEYENLTNELHQIKQTKDNIQSLLVQTAQERTMYKDKYQSIQQHEHTDDDINETKTSLAKLQNDYNEALANCDKLTQTLDTLRQEHSEEIANLMNQQQTKFDSNLKELNKEQDRLNNQLEEIENQHKKTIEILKIEFENTRKEQLSVLEDEYKATAKRAQDKIIDLSKQIDEDQKEINHFQILLNEQKIKSNQYEEELKEKSSQIIQFENELEKLKFQSNLSQKELTNEYNSLKEQYQQTIKSNMQNSEQLTILQEKFHITTKQLQNELDEKIIHIKNIEKQLEDKQYNINQLNTTIDQLKSTIKEHEQLQQTIETSQINNRQLLEEKDKMIDTLKQNYQSEIEKLHKEHEHTLEELKCEFSKEKSTINDKQDEINNLHQKLTSQNSELNEKNEQLSIYKIKLDEQENLNHKLQQQQNETYSQLEIKLNNILSEKTNLENELDHIRIQMQTMESNLNENNIQLEQVEQKNKEFQTERDSYQNEIETLKNEIKSLININEENIRRIDQYENEKFNFEQDINEKDRQIIERDEKIQEIELTLKQTQESATKFRKALQKMKESINNNEQKNPNDTEIQLQKTIQEYEQRLKEQEIEYNTKLKAIAKEMSNKIEENEYNYNQQLSDLIQKNNKTGNDLIISSEKRATNAEQRAYIAEEQMSKMQEQLKEKQLDNHRIIQDLQNQIEKLTKQIVQTTEHSSQTSMDDIYLNHSYDNQHSFVFEPTEIDYLKQIVLAYMTGTDRLTMAKVICAVLRYTDNEKSLIIEHEKLRQSRWLNATR
ncbi:unnamed protein product [Rotaria sordida]|uniref:GRIP domain-containing protein n=1 Tax=Rotaria sordida TaxID=392033 RepID=A0A814YHU3_9BILA|nr:unnamed protein product [Rotaria sordida]